jgi:hypothetical protein
VAGHGLDDWRSRFNPRQRQEVFPETSVSRPALGTGGPLPGGKARPACDAGHLPPSSSEVVNV